MSTAPSSATPPGTGVRRFGRFELVDLLGRSRRTMAWRVLDPRDHSEKVLVAPRSQSAGDEGLSAWQARVERASRVDHPGLLRPIEVGEQARWPFMLFLPEGRPLSARLVEGAAPGVPQEVAAMVAAMGRALALAHDAGVIHGDLQPWCVWTTGPDRVRLIGLEASGPQRLGSDLSGTDPDSGVVREGIASDIASLGVVMNWLLTAQRPLGLEDVGEVIDRLAPFGGEFLQMSSAAQGNLPTALRVIGNRAADRRESYRYRSMRTFLTAIEGWLNSRSGSGKGFLVEVRDKLRSGGGLPISAEAAERFSKIEQFEEERTSFLSEMLLEELPVLVELLRSINVRQQRDDRSAGSASVLTLKRAVALFGLRGVRRVALSLKRWPGALKPHEVTPFEKVMERCRSAARVAQGLRPAGFDAEIVFVVTILQNLGRIVLQYHFADQAAYVRNVMFQHADKTDGSVPGDDLEMTEEMACFAVLGVDMDSITGVALQYLGLDANARAICRRVSASSPVHPTRKDDDLLRFTASCAIEAVDALQWPSERAALELSQVMQRYGRVLKVDLAAMKRLLMPHGLDGKTIRAWVSRTPYAVADPDDDLL